MKAITREWIARSSDDLSAAEALLAREDLTNIVAFHWIIGGYIFRGYRQGLRGVER